MLHRHESEYNPRPSLVELSPVSRLASFEDGLQSLMVSLLGRTKVFRAQFRFASAMRWDFAGRSEAFNQGFFSRKSLPARS